MARVATFARRSPAGREGGTSTPVERLGRSWREMRRGTTTTLVTAHIFGPPGQPEHVDPTHLDVLDLLANEDGQTMPELAVALPVDPSTITRTMHRLEAAGLARRAPVPNDGRLVTAHLTDAGRRRHTELAARRAEVIGAGLAGLDPDEQQQ